MTLEELNRYAQVLVAGIPSEHGVFTLSGFRESQLTIDLQADLTHRRPGDGEGRTARVTLPGWAASGDAALLAEMDRIFYGAYTALVEASEEDAPAAPKPKASTKTFHLFTLRVTLTWDRRRKSLWQWLTGQQCPNELYLPGEGGIAACASPEQRERRRNCADPANTKKRIAEMPNLSALSDEELASRAKTAKLGEGVIAEVGAREWRKESQR